MNEVTPSNTLAWQGPIPGLGIKEAAEAFPMPELYDGWYSRDWRWLGSDGETERYCQALDLYWRPQLVVLIKAIKKDALLSL